LKDYQFKIHSKLLYQAFQCAPLIDQPDLLVPNFSIFEKSCLISTTKHNFVFMGCNQNLYAQMLEVQARLLAEKRGVPECIAPAINNNSGRGRRINSAEPKNVSPVWAVNGQPQSGPK